MASESSISKTPATDRKRKNPWDADAITLLNLLKEPGVVKNGEIDYSKLNNRIGERSNQDIKDKVKNWRKKYYSNTTKIEDIHFIQAKEAFDYIEGTKEVS